MDNKLSSVKKALDAAVVQNIIEENKKGLRDNGNFILQLLESNKILEKNSKSNV